MNFLIAHDRNAKHMAAWIIGQTVLALAVAAHAETPKESPGIQPIESLWLLTIPHFPGTSESDAALAKTLKQWQPTGVFDACSLLKFPPTFTDPQDFNRRANALMKEVGGRFIISTLPVGKEGWETSANERFAQKLATAGSHYDASKAMSQQEWLETLKDVNADTWAWVMEHSARMPTPEEAGRSAGEFARVAKAQHKQAVIWLTAQALTHGMEGLMQGICDATRADADFYVWMDLPGESLSAGEPQWPETMNSLLDKIRKMTPPQKTVIQWLNNPRWPTGNVEGTKTYIRLCQAKGINRFGVLMPPQGLLDREPWREFYRTLPKKTRAAAAK
jgi:hypothetical protein